MEILVDTIYPQIEKKIKDFNLAELANLDIQAIRDEFKYDECIALIKAIRSNEKQVNLLEKELTSYKIFNYSYQYTEENMSDYMDKMIKKKLPPHNYPTRDNIKADIILMSLDGGKDLLDSIKKKYGLD